MIRSFPLARNSVVPVSVLALGLSMYGQAPKQIQENASFGTTSDGKKFSLYTLRNPSGMEVTITNYGATVTTIKVMDKEKKSGDVILGFDSGDGYTSPKNTSYFGAVVGRYGNRIAGGKFTIDGHEYQVPTNDKPRPNSLHGGPHGFNSKVWDVKSFSEKNGVPTLELHYLSPDGEEGFPGNLDSTVRYSLNKDNSLRIEYYATTDKPTVLNLTNHTYFNLSGPGHSVLDHNITIDASRYTPVNANLIPTGELAPVAGTPFDFSKLTQIGKHVDDDNEQIKYGGGYDHNFVLNTRGNLKKAAVRVEEPTSGRVMEVFTDQPGVQFYTGNFLDGSVSGFGGAYEKRSALCLETQHFPDSPNQPKFPTTLLRPGQKFRSTTVYKFSVK